MKGRAVNQSKEVAWMEVHCQRRGDDMGTTARANKNIQGGADSGREREKGVRGKEMISSHVTPWRSKGLNIAEGQPYEPINTWTNACINKHCDSMATQRKRARKGTPMSAAK